MNLHDHEEAYHAQAIYATDRVHRKYEENKNSIEDFLERAAEIEVVYQDMVKDGLVKDGEFAGDEFDFYYQTGREEKLSGVAEKVHGKIVEMDEYKEREIVRILVEKYYGMIEFYLEQKEKEEQVKIAQEELQNVLSVQSKMEFYYSLDPADEIVAELNAKKYNVPFELPRVQKRLAKMKCEYARYIYEEATFNFEMLEFAIKEFYKKFHALKNRFDDLQNKKMKNDKNNQNGANRGKPSFFGLPLSVRDSLFGMGGIVQILLVFLVIVTFFLGYQFGELRQIDFFDIFRKNMQKQ